MALLFQRQSHLILKKNQKIILGGFSLPHIRKDYEQNVISYNIFCPFIDLIP